MYAIVNFDGSGEIVETLTEAMEKAKKYIAERKSPMIYKAEDTFRDYFGDLRAKIKSYPIFGWLELTERWATREEIF